MSTTRVRTMYQLIRDYGSRDPRAKCSCCGFNTLYRIVMHLDSWTACSTCDTSLDERQRFGNL